MTIWTTFCPSKICWELTCLQTPFGSAQGKQGKPTSNWLEHQDLIVNSLKLLKKYGISGIRLAIFPNEITRDGKTYDWTALDTMLDLCQKQNLLVDVCLGPYQFPYYPGIYLPHDLLEHVHDNDKTLDASPQLLEFGLSYIQSQLKRYGDDKRIAGFHFANEWPDRQNVEGKEKIKKAVSEDFMLKASSLIASSTDKPIRLNTNIDVSDKRRITNIFTNIFTNLKNQGYLGFDIYPSQETWKKALLVKFLRLFVPYWYSFYQIRKVFKDYNLYFTEVEAQPWGDGRSWFRIITSEINPQKKVLSYSPTSLPTTWNKYLKRTNCEIISLWGSDFWVVSHAMGITWPFEKVQFISSQAA